MHERCPKCGHAPLPADQAFPAACPGCGVILARVGTVPARRAVASLQPVVEDDDAVRPGLRAALLHVPARVDATAWRVRVALLAAIACWSVWLVRADVADGSIMASFVHLPLLVFHEAGHVIFRPFGHTLTILGGSLNQVLVPAIVCGAFLVRNRDPYGAAFGLWFAGVALLDVAPYVYDALEPQLVLLNGQTGEEGGHDWIQLLTGWNLLPRAPALGRAVHAAGTAVVLLALAWAAWVLARQKSRVAGDVLIEE